MLNGVIVLDKPLHKTSHDMVYFVRRLLSQKRVGHTGTLDPEASGVLPVCVGMATKASDFIMNSGKEYVATVTLGVVTTTQDATGEVLETHEVAVSEEDVTKAVLAFVGDIEQVPPMYSAIKQDGQKLCDLARRGITVERKKRMVHIDNIIVSDFDAAAHTFQMKVSCSKGTYIRTLAHDIGMMLGCGAHMSALRRTKSGGFTLESAHTLDELLQMKEDGTLEQAIVSIETIYQSYEPITLNEKQTFKAQNGVPIALAGTDGAHYRVYSCEGEFLCVSTIDDNRLIMDTSFWCGG